MPSHPVLLAEDNEHDALVVAGLFRTCGILNPLHVVGNGRGVIRYLRGEGLYADRAAHPLPVLLLLDVRMPVADGVDVLRWLHTQPKPAFPIVMLTAYEDLKAMGESYRLGAHTFLLKPIRQSDFLPLLRAFPGVDFEPPGRERPV